MTEVRVEEFKSDHGTVYKNFRLARSCRSRVWGLGLVAVFISLMVRGETWTHGRMSLSEIQKFKFMVRFFISTLNYLIFFGGN